LCGVELGANPAFGFHFGAREGIRRDEMDGDAEVEGGLEEVLDGSGEVCGGVGGRFDLDFHFGEGICGREGDAVFGDFREFGENVFDRAWVDVDAADDGHVIDATENAAFKGKFGAAARADFFGGGADDVAGAVAEEGRAFAGECGEDEFTGLAGGDGRSGFWVENFGDEGMFHHVKAARRGGAFEGDRADFGHAMVVEDFGAGPELFEFRADAGDAAAGFARDEDAANAAFAEVDVFGGGGFGESRGVGGGAAEDGGLGVEKHAKARGAGHAASGDAKATEALGGVEGHPESEKRAKGERKKDAVGAMDAGDFEDFDPALDDGFPGFGGVQPADGGAGGAAGLVEASVVFDRIEEDCAEGWVLDLVSREFGFCCERMRAREIGEGCRCAEVREFASVKSIGRYPREQFPQLGELASFDFGTAGH
jgi:hypothetical protein